MTRVLQVTHRYPPQTGGVETHVRELSERLVTRGHEVTVFSADAGEAERDAERRGGVDIRRFDAFAPAETLYFAPGVAPAVRRHDADIVHAHNYHAFPALFAVIGSTDTPFVFTTHYHGSSASAVRDRLLSLYEPLGGWTMRQADEVIAVSEWEHARIREDFGVDAIVIPNGLSVDRFENASPEDRDGKYLLCVGRLEKYKGVQHVIRALTQLPEYDLVIAGTGSYREELARFAEQNGVAERIEFLGFVPDERLPELYAGANVFLNLSTHEAYGMTVAEALASGTPCVVRSRRGLRDWVSEDSVVDVEAVGSLSVSEAVHEAATLSVTASIPDWDDVTQSVRSVYSRLI